jgi:hypothetical protein
LIALAQPALAQPALAQPALAQPALAQPALTQPALAQSAVAEPNYHFFQQIHERMHTGESPYLCSICAKAFKRKEALEHHAVVHKKDLPKVSFRTCIATLSYTVLFIRMENMQGILKSHI